MTRYYNPAAPGNAPAVKPPAAGEITDPLAPFRPSALSPSQHPALRGGSAGGEVAGVDRSLAEALAGKAPR